MFNIGLYKEGLRKTRTLAILFLIVMILGAIIQPLAEMANHLNSWPRELGHIYGLHASYMMMFALFAGAPLFTLSIFSFLNKRSSSDFYHAIPHKRETLFGSFIVAVLTWVVGGMWLSTAISVILYTVIIPYAVVNLSSVMLVLVGMSAACLLVISAITLAMTVTGTHISNIMTAGLIIFLPRLLTTMFMMMVVHGARIVDIGDFAWLENQNIVVGFFSESGSSYDQMITSGTTYTLILSIIYLIIAGYLFKKRHSELAENPGSRLTQPIIRIAVTFTMTIPAMGLLIDMHSADFLGIVVLYLIALIGYFAYEFLTTKRIPQLIKMVPGLLIVVLLNVAFIAGVRATCGVILQEINVEDIASVTIVDLNTSSYAGVNARELSITDEQVVTFLGETLNDNIRVSRARLRGDSNENWWYNREISVTFNISEGRNVTRRVRFDNETHMSNMLMDYEPYQALYLAIPENFDTAHSWDDLTNEEINHVLDVLRDEVQEVDFATWHKLFIDGYSELATYGHIGIGGVVNGHHYHDSFPITDLTPRTLDLYRSYARQNIFNYQGSYLGDASTVGNILTMLGASYEGMSLSTHEAPYGLTLMNVRMTSEELLSISAWVFTLFPEADWISYEIETGKITVSREQIVNFLGETEFKSEEALIDRLQERLDQEDLPEFLEGQ